MDAPVDSSAAIINRSIAAVTETGEDVEEKLSSYGEGTEKGKHKPENSSIAPSSCKPTSKASSPLKQNSIIHESLPRTPLALSKDSFFKTPSHKLLLAVQTPPGWQRVYQYLVDAVIVMPTSLIRKSLDDYYSTGDLDEVALSIWTLQSYKRFLRSLDPEFSENPKRLFIPPNAAQAIESALLNGYQGSACDMLKKLWQLVSPIGAPEHVIVLVKKKGHWVVHW